MKRPKLANTFNLVTTVSALAIATSADGQINLPNDSAAFNPHMPTSVHVFYSNDWSDGSRSQLGLTNASMLDHSIGFQYVGRMDDRTRLMIGVEKGLEQNGPLLLQAVVPVQGRVYGGAERNRPERFEWYAGAGAGYQTGMEKHEGWETMTPWFLQARVGARASLTVAKSFTLAAGYDFTLMQGFQTNGSGAKTGVASTVSATLTVPLSKIKR